jgi:polar amino acid transport system substrate-binding protein
MTTSAGASRRTVLKSSLTLGLVAPFAGTLLSACGDDSPAVDVNGDTLKRIQDSGKVKIAIGNEPPYTELQADGTLTGAGPDMVKAIMKELGVSEVEGITTPYDAMIPGIKAGRWDIIVGSLFINKARCGEILFGEPEIVATESLAVPTGNPKNLASVADLTKGGVKVGILPGSFEASVAKSAGVPPSNMISIPDNRSGIDALNAGRIDAYLLPTLSLDALKKQTNDFDTTGVLPDYPKQGCGSGFRKADTKLRDEYNRVLADLKSNGTFAEVLDKWGFDPSAAEGVTTEQLCKLEV